MSVMFVGDNVWSILRYEYDHTQETDDKHVCMHVRTHTSVCMSDRLQSCMDVHTFVIFKSTMYVFVRTRTADKS